MTKELQTINHENTIALWAERIAACRNSDLSVVQWCKENEVCVQTYYRWQKKLFTLAQAQQEPRFAEITPARVSSDIAVTVRIAGVEADIHSGADAAVIEAVLRILKSC